MDQLLQNKLALLPVDLKKEVLDYVEFLLYKYKKEVIPKRIEKEKVQEKTFSFDWEGEISELNKQYSSVELQHKGNEWR